MTARQRAEKSLKKAVAGPSAVTIPGAPNRATATFRSSSDGCGPQRGCALFDSSNAVARSPSLSRCVSLDTNDGRSSIKRLSSHNSYCRSCALPCAASNNRIVTEVVENASLPATSALQRSASNSCCLESARDTPSLIARSIRKGIRAREIPNLLQIKSQAKEESYLEDSSIHWSQLSRSQIAPANQ